MMRKPAGHTPWRTRLFALLLAMVAVLGVGQSAQAEYTNFGTAGRVGMKTRFVVSRTLQPGSIIAQTGDSIVALGVSNNASANLTGLSTTINSELLNAQSFLPIFRVLQYPCADATVGKYHCGSIDGVGGETSTDTLNRFNLVPGTVRPMLSKRPAAVILSTGTNNIALTGQTIVADITMMAREAEADGTLPIIATLRPAGSAASPPAAATQTAFQQVNAALRTLAANNNWPLADFAAWYGAPDAWAAPTTGYLNSDNLHPSALGATAAGQKLAQMLSPLFSAQTNIFTTALGATSLTAMTAAQRIFNGGTAGGKGTAVTGTVASLLSVGANTTSVASTVVASLESNTDSGGSSQVLTVTPANTNATETLPISFVYSGPSLAEAGAGGWVQAWAEIEDDGNAFTSQVYWSFSEAGASPARGRVSGSGTANVAMAPHTGRRFMISQPLQVSGTPGNAVFALNFTYMPQAAVAANQNTLTFKLRRWGISTVPDPHISLNAVGY